MLEQLTARLVERALQAERTEHLGYEKQGTEGKGAGNARNGMTSKTLPWTFSPEGFRVEAATYDP